jgi:hypothetical protein
MRQLSSDLREFIHLLNTKGVKRAANRDKDLGDIRLLENTKPSRQ